MQHELVVLPDAGAVAVEAAERVVAWALDAVERHGRFSIALSGGSTPSGLYRLLVADSYASRMPWERTHLFWGDERHLPPGDSGRNDTDVLPLLARTGVPAGQIHPVPYVSGDPAAAARNYQALLRQVSGLGGPLLDLVLLGLGSDGHTASLFPGTPALAEEERLVVPNHAVYEDRYPERITLTFPALNAAGAVLFLVTGSGKRDILARVLGDPEDPPLPAQRVQPAHGSPLWLVDRAAGARLDESMPRVG